MPFEMLRVLLLLSFSLILSACGRDGSNPLPDAPRDEEAPTIVSTNLSGEGSDNKILEVDQNVRIVFSELMDFSSLENAVSLYSGEKESESSFALPRDSVIQTRVVLGEGTDLITGDTIDVDATELFLMNASGRFGLDVVYTVEVTEEARDLADDPSTLEENEANTFLSNAYFVFSTQSGSWQEFADLIDLEESGDIADLVSASNESGDSLVVWRQIDDNGESRIWASRYVIQNDDYYSSWEAPSLDPDADSFVELVDVVPETSALGPQISINENGQAAVVWYQEPSDTAVTSSIWVRRFDNGWQNAEDISFFQQGATDSAVDPKVSIDAAGNILVVWREEENGTFTIKSRYYSALLDADNLPEGWQAITKISEDGADNAHVPQLSSAANGLALLLWSQDVGAERHLSFSEFSAGSKTWSAPYRVDTVAGGKVNNPTLKIDNNLDGLALWEEEVNGVISVWWARYSAGGWQQNSVELFETNDAVNSYSPVLEVSPTNQYIVHWLEGDSSFSRLKTRSFNTDSGWDVEIEEFDSGRLLHRMLRFDKEGNANLIWRKLGNESLAFVRRYVNGNGWRTIDTLQLPAFPEGDICLDPGQQMALGCSKVLLNPILKTLKDDGRMMALWPAKYKGENKIAWSLFSDHPQN